MKCVICQDREPDQSAVCDPDRRGITNTLRDLVDAYTELTGAEQPDPRGLLIDDTGDFDGPMVYDVLPLTAGPVRAPTRGAQVTGSREAPVPVQLDVVDLTAAARQPNPTRGPGYYPRSLWPEDQVGHQPVATRLDQWVRDWISYTGCPGDHLPEPTVPALAAWLGVRVDWACDEHPAIQEFVAEMRGLVAAIRRALGDRPQYPELCDGVPCSRCDAVGALYRQPNSSYRAECGACGKLYTEDEWDRWTGLVAGQVKAA